MKHKPLISNRLLIPDGNVDGYITSDTLQPETPKIATDQMNSSCSTTITFNRKGWRYRKMNADEKVLHFLNAYWKQLIAYRYDGRYTIDNSLAERCIRPLAVERKNSLFFGSHTGAETFAIYHTFIETCKMNGISSLEYFKKLFREILTGRNDYANLYRPQLESNKN